MIDALIAGKLYGAPAERTAKNGNRFAIAKVRVATVTGEGIFVNVIAFAASAVESLLALTDGDSVAMSGELTPKVWTDKNGEARPALDLVAHAVLTAYHVTRKRQAINNPSEAAA
jgi:single-stranded DNA-binding protein